MAGVLSSFPIRRTDHRPLRETYAPAGLHEEAVNRVQRCEQEKPCCMVFIVVAMVSEPTDVF